MTVGLTASCFKRSCLNMVCKALGHGSAMATVAAGHKDYRMSVKQPHVVEESTEETNEKADNKASWLGHESCSSYLRFVNAVGLASGRHHLHLAKPSASRISGHVADWLGTIMGLPRRPGAKKQQCWPMSTLQTVEHLIMSVMKLS